LTPAGKGDILRSTHPRVLVASPSLSHLCPSSRQLSRNNHFYVTFSDSLNIPVVMRDLGHGGRTHSPNEYATLEGMRQYEKSIAALLTNLAAG